MPDRPAVPPSFLDYLERTPEILAAYLFGSVAAGRAHRFSDVDIALLLAEGVDREREWDIEVGVSDAAERGFRRRADIVMLNRAGSLVKFQVIHRGWLIFERDRNARAGFEVRAHGHRELLRLDLRPQPRSTEGVVCCT